VKKFPFDDRLSLNFAADFMLGPDRYKSTLTDLLEQNGSVSLFDVLKHPKLSDTARNEAIQLVDYLANPDLEVPGQTRLCTLMDWALSDTRNKALGPLLQPYQRFQINHNASVLLSSPSRRLWMKLLEAKDQAMSPFHKLISFIPSGNRRNPHAVDCRFAGNFQRVFANFLRSSDSWIQWINKDQFEHIVQFALKNINCMAYQQLLVLIVMDFSSPYCKLMGGGNEKLRDYIRLIVSETATQVHLVHQCCIELTTAELNQSLIQVRHDAIRRCPDNSWNRPINWKGENIPPWRFSKIQPSQNRTSNRFTENSFLEMERLLGELNVTFTQSELPSDRADIDQLLEDGKISAYLLLLTVMNCLTEQLALADLIRDDMDIVRLVLLSGVFADPHSIVSVEAFRIVRVLVEGLRDFDNPEKYVIQPIAADSGIYSVIDEFAGFFEFGLCLTPQMVAAFPLFFGHHYENLRSDQPPGPVVIPLDQPSEDSGIPVTAQPEPFRYVHPNGLTPLEFYAHFLLDDPAVSDQLCQAILQVLQMLEKRANEIRKYQDGKNFYEYQREVIRAYLPIFDFLRSCQPHGLPKLDETQLTETKRALYNTIHSDMRLVGVYIPPFLPGQHSRRVESRAILNGGIVAFAVWWLNIELFWLDERFGSLSFCTTGDFVAIPETLSRQILGHNFLVKDFEENVIMGAGKRRFDLAKVDELGVPQGATGT
jgi:hypothetical protein